MANFLLFSFFFSFAAWVSSIFTGFRCLAAPVAAVLMEVCGAKGASIIGVLIFILGGATCTTATQLYHLYFTAAICGMGAGISCVLSMKFLSLAFPKSGSLSTSAGLATRGTGAGVGIIIYAFAGSVAMESSGWRGYYYVLVGMGVFSLFTLVFLPENIPVGPKTSANTAIAAGFTKKLAMSVTNVKDGFTRGIVLYKDPGFRIMVCTLMFYAIGAYFPLISVVSLGSFSSVTFSSVFFFFFSIFRNYSSRMHASNVFGK